MEKITKKQKSFIRELYEQLLSCASISKKFNEKFKTNVNSKKVAKILENEFSKDDVNQQNGPRVLVYDIETAPIEAYVWGLWDNNVSLNQIVKDWSVLSWSAKWLNEDKILYEDNRDHKDPRDDSKLLKSIWALLDEADIVVTQNGKSFDQKKLNARFILNGMQPPSSYKHIDTKVLAKKHFGFTSNRLEYMTDKLCNKFKKLKHQKFPGQELWTQCLKGNLEAWKEMEEYNKYDVLSLEELYNKLMPWDNTINFNLYHNHLNNVCHCGSTEFKKKGFNYTASSKFQRYKCKKCGSETKSKINEFSKEKKKSLRPKSC